jgi:phospholipase/lecithinase/hemolysin
MYKLSRRTMALIAGLFIASPAAAQVQSTGSLFEFGDSTHDVGYDCAGFKTPLKACSNYRNTPMQLGSISAYRFVPENDFAIGGTATGPDTISDPDRPLYPGYPAGTYPNMFGQIEEFARLGRRIGPNDLVLISFAGNDIRYGDVGPELAHKVVGYLTKDVQSLADLGGRHFILYGGIPFDRLGIPAFFGIPDEADRQYYTTLNAELPGAMAKLESPSVHIQIMDMNKLFNQALDNPAQFGLISGDCAKTPDCPTAPLATQNHYAFFNLHPSDSFSVELAKAINDLLVAP